MPKSIPLADRFWSHVDKSGDCWLWTGATVNGYGSFGRNRGTKRSHRVAWILTNGPIPPGLYVLHHCDNPPCVRPDHLFLGSAADNTADMDAKGRSRRVALPGSTNPNAKLTDGDVRDIRARLGAGTSRLVLAREYSVTPGLISHIKLRRRWSHVV